MKRYRPGLSTILLAGILLGALAGFVFGQRAIVVQPLGDIFLNLMFTLVVPLVFVSIASATANMADLRRLGKILGATATIFVVSGLIAGVLVLVTVEIFPPAVGTSVKMAASQMEHAKSLGEILVSSLTVNDFPLLLSRKNMLPLILFSVVFGLCVSICGGQESPVGRLLNNLNDVVMKFVDLVMYYAPVGLGAYFAALVGQFGPELIGDYGRVLVIYYPLCVLYFGVAFTAYAWLAGGGRGVRAFYGSIGAPAVTAFATGSSVATLPVNLEACRSIGVPKDVRELVLPLGATMHMDGSVLAAVIKIAFLYGVFDLPFTGLSTWAAAIGVSVLAAFVLSGAPGGGLVGEMLIVTLFGFPPEAFPLIATIGFLVDQPATCLNATGDTVAAMLVSRFIDGPGWMDRIRTED